MSKLTGQAKTDYQREYMRNRRSNNEPLSVRPDTQTVRPVTPELVRPIERMQPVICNEPEPMKAEAG